MCLVAATMVLYEILAEAVIVHLFGALVAEVGCTTWE